MRKQITIYSASKIPLGKKTALDFEVACFAHGKVIVQGASTRFKRQATHYLITRGCLLSTTTEAMGYQSEAAFSTAFKRHFDIRLGEYRQKHQEA